MGCNERIFNAVLFELVALAIIVPITSNLIGKNSGDLVIVGIGLSLYTVVWNYVYTLYFDKWFGNNRLERTVVMRIGHTLGFEGGLIFVSIPVIAWFLQITLFQALMLEAGFLVFFLFYAIGFHWLYDTVEPFGKIKKLLKLLARKAERTS